MNVASIILYFKGGKIRIVYGLTGYNVARIYKDYSPNSRTAFSKSVEQ